VGAFEYGRRAPSLSVEASRATALAAEPVTFIATTSDPDLGDAVVVGWSFDDGTTATGIQVTHAFAGPGLHAATATATDSVGLTTVRAVTVAVTKPVQGFGRPATIGLKGPKKVRRGKPAIFRFSSSEAGGTFRCKVDNRPFKPCTSPYKVRTNKLDPGRKHTFSVFAIDSAGNADATPLERSFRIKGRR
jgi:PKD repeat protein